VNRRDLLIFSASAGLTAALPAGAQQKPVPVIGFLSPGSPGPGGPLLAAFRQGLSETGYTEGQKVTIEYR